MIKNILSTNLMKSASIYTFSTFINSAIPFVLLPILTRYLTTEEYGILSMFNATASFLIPFIGLSINAGIQRKLVDGNEKESKEYIFNSFLIMSVATLAVSILFLIFSEQISRYTAIPRILLPYTIVFSGSSCICNVLLAYFQIKEETKKYAWFQNLCTALNVSLSILLVMVFGLSLNGRIYGIVYSKMIFALFAFFYIVKYIKGNHNKANIGFIKDELFNFALPLIPTEIKATVLTYTDRIFLTNIIGTATTGVYSLGNQFSLPILMLEQSFNLAFIPWLYKKLKENKEEEKRKIVKISYIYFGAVFIIALIWSGIAKPLIKIIGGKGFEEAHLYVIWLSIGYAFAGMHMMVVNYIYYMKKLKMYTIVTVAVMFMNIILNIILIDKNGSIGAAQATMLCNIVSFIGTWIMSMKVYPMPWLLLKK